MIITCSKDWKGTSVNISISHLLIYHWLDLHHMQINKVSWQRDCDFLKIKFTGVTLVNKMAVYKF